jgi:hypothetical protein
MIEIHANRKPERKGTEQTNPFYSLRGQQLRDVRIGRLKSVERR